MYYSRKYIPLFKALAMLVLQKPYCPEKYIRIPSVRNEISPLLVLLSSAHIENNYWQCGIIRNDKLIRG